MIAQNWTFCNIMLLCQVMAGERLIDDSAERDPQVGFSEVLSAVRRKFIEAALEEAKAPHADWPFVSVDWHPQTGTPIGTFALAAQYEELIQSRSRAFILSIPLLEYDPLNPVASEKAEDAYFVMGYPGRDENTATVTEADYESVLAAREAMSPEDFVLSLEAARPVFVHHAV